MYFEKLRDFIHEHPEVVLEECIDQALDRINIRPGTPSLVFGDRRLNGSLNFLQSFVVQDKIRLEAEDDTSFGISYSRFLPEEDTTSVPSRRKRQINFLLRNGRAARELAGWLSEEMGFRYYFENRKFDSYGSDAHQVPIWPYV